MVHTSLAWTTGHTHSRSTHGGIAHEAVWCVLRERHHHGQKYSQRGRQAAGTPTHGPASACGEMSIAALVLATHDRTGSARLLHSAVFSGTRCTRPSYSHGARSLHTRTASPAMRLAYSITSTNPYSGASLLRARRACASRRSQTQRRESRVVDPENPLGAFSAPSRSLLGTFSEPSRRVPTPPPSPPWPPTRSTRASLRGCDPGMREV